MRVFIGYDSREPIAYHVLAHSIMRRASRPVSITGLILKQLPLTRDRDARQSTDFAFSRFLVPWLCGYEGRAIFMDCDMLCQADIADLWNTPLDGAAVSVVKKHDYMPNTTLKFLGQSQSVYRRKNWSSVMLFDNSKCRALTPDYVNTASGLDLHQFKWLGAAPIGSLPSEWNHLVGEQAPRPDVKLVHYTLGGPWFPGFEDCEYAAEWRHERNDLLGKPKESECPTKSF